MNTSRRNLLKVAALGGVQAMAPLVARHASAQTPSVTLKLTYSDTPTHPAARAMERFAENVNKRTNGAIKIEVFSVGQLGSQTNILTGLRTGIIDFCAHASGFVETLLPKWQVVDLPFIFPDSAAAERVLDGPIGKQLLDMMPDKGIYGLSWGHWGWRTIDTSNRKLTSPADIKGLKIRVPPGPVFTSIWRTLGANPVSIDLTEVFLALSQKTIDAVDIPVIALPSTKLYEVVNTVNLSHHQYNVGVLMAAKRKLDSLAPAHQEAIRAAGRDLTIDWRKSVAEGTDAATKLIKEKGLTLVPVDRETYRKATEPVYAELRSVIGGDLIDAVVKQAGRTS